MRTALIVLVLSALIFGPVMTAGAREVPKDLRSMLQILEARKVNVDFEDLPLSEVLKFFSNATGVNLVLSPMVTEKRDAADLTVTLRLNEVSVKTALSIVLKLKDLASVYRHGVIMITTPQDARGKPTLKIYPISDLTFRLRDFPAPDIQLRPSGAEDFGAIGGREEEGREHAFADPESIMDLVQENTGTGTWEDDGVRISVNERFLVVRQYGPVHHEIGRLLNLLRAFR
jgi:hypothetical protein